MCAIEDDLRVSAPLGRPTTRVDHSADGMNDDHSTDEMNDGHSTDKLNDGHSTDGVTAE
jgi:hypothetical protein